MKILYYSPHPALNLASPAGYATHMREMIAAFRENGHQVQTFIVGGEELPVANGNPVESNKVKTAVKKVVPGIIWESLKDLSLFNADRIAESSLLKIIEEFRPDVIYERLNYGQLSGVNAAKKMGIRHVYEINAPYLEERVALSGKSLLQRQASAIEQKQLALSDRLFVVSSALKQHFLEKYNVDESKFVVTPNAVNLNHINGQSSPVFPLGTDFSGNFVFGFVGSIFPWHGVDLLITSFSKLAWKYPDTRLLIVGDGETLPLLKDLVKEAGIEKRVCFTGNVPYSRIFPYINMMDVTVMMKSNWYGSPVKIFEYGAIGKPIIAPSTMPVKDVMVHMKDGLLVDPNPQSVLEAMEWMINNRESAKEMAQSFRRKVINQHQWKHNAQAIIESL